jgi:hypothetical protein
MSQPNRPAARSPDNYWAGTSSLFAAFKKVNKMSADTTILKNYRPPYGLTSDFLFVVGLSATGPLRRSFPEVPFLSVFGKTPLVLWFSRITEACYYDSNGQRQCDRDTEQIPYTELTVITLLYKRALFVPRLYASSQLSVQIASIYSMPKILHSVSWRESNGQLFSSLVEKGHHSLVQARLFKGGKMGATLISPMLPVTTWPAQFPAKSSVRAIIQNVPSVQLALIRKGQLSLPELWLPEPVPFFPIGLYLPQLTMSLPPP